MSQLLDLFTYTDLRGSLTVTEQEIPFVIKRVYYIYNVGENITRGGHRHHKTIQALICISGSCEIFVNDGDEKQTFLLDSPSKCLILDAKDWHTMSAFSNDGVLLVLASELYDVNDYIDEEYA